MVTNIRNEAVSYGSLGNVPNEMQANVRNQMYLASESMRLLPKFGPKMSEARSHCKRGSGWKLIAAIVPFPPCLLYRCRCPTIDVSDEPSSGYSASRPRNLRQTMARLFTILLLCLSSLAFGTRAMAQPVRPEPAKAGTAVSLSLGHSTNQPIWAQPEFDDSTWETVDLTPTAAANSPGASSEYVAGWGKRGHSGYAGYAWYRIRVRVDAQPGEKLALAGPPSFDDAYQLFLNGRLLGSFGRFDGKRPKFYYAQPVVFPLPGMIRKLSFASGCRRQRCCSNRMQEDFTLLR
jgi:hypothetical protein